VAFHSFLDSKKVLKRTKCICSRNQRFCDKEAKVPQRESFAPVSTDPRMAKTNAKMHELLEELMQ